MSIEIKAVKRDVKGTGASRRLRRAGSVPGVVYGGEQSAVSIVLDHKELFLQFRHESFHASILNLVLDGKAESVLLRDYQLHPVRNTIQHIDFQRVSASEKIHVKVPFHFVNEDAAPGVKLGGGSISHIQTEADISCLAKDLPEFIEIDLSKLETGHSVHLSEIKLPKGVEFVQLAHGDDAAIATILKPRGGDDSAEAETPEAPAAE
jgi:large subunit ribosomal protein L25